MAFSGWTSLVREWIVVVALTAVAQIPGLSVSVSAVLAVSFVRLDDVVPVLFHVVPPAVVDVRSGAGGVAAAEVVCGSLGVVALASVGRRAWRAVVAEASVARGASL